MMFFFWIGTDGSTKLWENPATNNKISITYQGNHRYAPPYTLVDRNYNLLDDRDYSHTFCLQGLNSHVIFDLKTVKLKLISYTLQHRTANFGGALRRWQFEGSNDKSNWDILEKHTNDKSLKKEKGSMATWKISTNQFYCCFRIVITGTNSSRSPNLWISQVKLHGVVVTI